MVLWEIYRSLQQRKNFANRSRIDKVIAMVMVAQLFYSQCRMIFYANVYGSYKLLKTVQFFGPPCIMIIITSTRSQLKYC